MPYFTIEIEADECGFHAIVIDEADGICHVSNTYANPDDAAHAARSWIDHNARIWPLPA